MSRSLQRVEQALRDAGLSVQIRALGDARTAQMAAAVAGCQLDQISKSIIFAGATSGHCVLFLTAGGNRVAIEKASALAGEPLVKADAALIRAETGFAIGGVAPVGHVTPIRSFIDPRLLEFSTLWAAAGTPQHIFEIAATDLARITGATIADFTEATPM